MVVKRDDLFKGGIWHGIKTENLKKYLNIISQKHYFMSRHKVENDPSWQQIIPYLVFENQGVVFIAGFQGEINRRCQKNRSHSAVFEINNPVFNFFDIYFLLNRGKRHISLRNYEFITKIRITQGLVFFCISRHLWRSLRLFQVLFFLLLNKNKLVQYAYQKTFHLFLAPILFCFLSGNP